MTAASAIASEPTHLRVVRSIVLNFTLFCVSVIAGLAFYASFEAISAYVVEQGIFTKDEAWIAPLLLDTFTAVGTTLSVWLSLTLETPLYKSWECWFAYTLVALGSLTSLAANVEHVTGHGFAKVVAGAPSAALLFSIEVLVIIARHHLTRHSQAAAARAARRRATPPPSRRPASQEPAVSQSAPRIVPQPAPRPRVDVTRADSADPQSRRVRGTAARNAIAEARARLIAEGVISADMPTTQQAARIYKRGGTGIAERTIETHVAALRKAEREGQRAIGPSPVGERGAA